MSDHVATVAQKVLITTRDAGQRSSIGIRFPRRHLQGRKSDATRLDLRSSQVGLRADNHQLTGLARLWNLDVDFEQTVDVISESDFDLYGALLLRRHGNLDGAQRNVVRHPGSLSLVDVETHSSLPGVHGGECLEATRRHDRVALDDGRENSRSNRTVGTALADID